MAFPEPDPDTPEEIQESFSAEDLLPELPRASAITMEDAKLKAVFPGLSCAGWDLASHPVDAEAVRAMREE